MELLVLNISIGGILVEMPAPGMPRDTPIRLEALSFSPEPMDVHGSVVHTSSYGAADVAVGIRLRRNPAQRLAGALAEEEPSEAAVRVSALAASATSVADFCKTHPYAFLLPVGNLDRDGLDGALARLRPEQTALCVLGRRGNELWQAVSVGREPGTDIVIPSKRISRDHAAFERDPETGQYLLVDRGSRNGTAVDGLLLGKAQGCALKSKALIDFGGLRFVFLLARDMFLALSASGLALRAASTRITPRWHSEVDLAAAEGSVAAQYPFPLLVMEAPAAAVARKEAIAAPTDSKLERELERVWQRVADLRRAGTTTFADQTALIVFAVAAEGSADDAVSVGRGAAADVKIPDSRISKVHAIIERDAHTGSYTLRDAGSRNGTRLNDRVLVPGERAALSAGDRIALGPLAFSFNDAAAMQRRLKQRSAQRKEGT